MRLRLLVLLASCALAIPLIALLHTGADDPQRAVLTAANSQHHLKVFTSTTQWNGGRRSGTAASAGTLTLSRATSTVRMGGRGYDRATWTSPWIAPRFTFTEVIPSWSVATPGRAHIVVQLRARATTGKVGTWQSLGRWSTFNDRLLRTSSGPQTNAIARINTDTLQAANGARLNGYQARLILAQPSGTTNRPRVTSLHTVASSIGGIPATSKPSGVARTLAVPSYSQMIHSGEYPEYGGGGQAWCSPTSLSMILGYHKRLPTSYAWVKKGTDRFVDEVARRVYDFGYQGAGNWPFNVAYANSRGLEGRVTRLTDLRVAENYIAAGIPLEASISFGRGQLSGAPISATAGHLVVIVGFTKAGNVVVNDPAASSNAGVRRIYDRAQFEAAWQRKSHGLVYAIKRIGAPWTK